MLAAYFVCGMIVATDLDATYVSAGSGTCPSPNNVALSFVSPCSVVLC